jgi:NAD(P)H-flavin reductase
MSTLFEKLGGEAAVDVAVNHKRHPSPIRLYFGASSPDRLYFTKELLTLCDAYPQFECDFCVDEGARAGHYPGSPLARATEQNPNLANTLVYLCGHPALVRAAQRQCFLAGANMKDISADPFEAYC